MVKPRSLDRVVAAAAEAAAEEAIDRKVDELTQEGQLDSIIHEATGHPPHLPPAVDDLLSSVPSGEGYYMKLYREIHPGQYEFKMRIDDYSNWTDLESEVVSIVQAYTKRDKQSWGSGKYRILVYKDGARGIYSKPLILNVDARESETTIPSRSNGGDAKEKLAEMAGLIKEVKSLMGGQTNPAEVTKMMADAFKAGLEILPKTDSDGKDSPLKVIALLKELGLIGQLKEEKKIDPSQMMRDTITMLKDMGLIGQPKIREGESSLRETITFLKDLGLVGQPPSKDDTPREDPYAMVEKVANLITLVKTIGGGGEGVGEKPSLGVELVRILGPRVPEMVGRITDSVNNVAEVSKMKMERRMGVDLGTTRPPVPPSLNPPGPLPTPVVESPQTNPVVKEIYEAIESRNKEFYPRLKQLLDIYIGPHIIPVIVSGQMTQEIFLNNLSASLQNPYFAEEKARVYFSEFISSFTPSDVSPATPKEGMVIGKCNGCETEFEFDSEERFEHDTKQCDGEGCGGMIEKVLLGAG